MTLRYAHATAAIAVALTVAGGATAAIRVPSGSVGSKQLKKHAVGAPKVAPSAIRHRNIAKIELRRVDVRPSELITGPTGPTGPTGATGNAGPARFAALRYVTTTTTVPADDDASGTATCPSLTGWYVIGGGAAIDGAREGDALITESASAGAGWRGYAENYSPDDRTMSVFAICSQRAPRVRGSG